LRIGVDDRRRYDRGLLSGEDGRKGEQALVLNGVLGKIRVDLPAGAAVKIAAHTLVGKTRVFEQDRNGFSATVIYATPGYAAASHRLRIDIANVVGEIIVR